jgi:hypothetical protein
MQLDVTLQARHATALRELLQRPDGIEAAAYVMFGRNIVGIDPWSRRRRLRLISHQVVPVPAGDEISASARHVTWSTASFVSLCRQAAERGLVPAIVHSHPAGLRAFSRQDNANERDLYRLLRNRNGNDAIMASVLLAGGDHFMARAWLDDKEPVAADTVAVSEGARDDPGAKVQIGLAPPGDSDAQARDHRQAQWVDLPGGKLEGFKVEHAQRVGTAPGIRPCAGEPAHKVGMHVGHPQALPMASTVAVDQSIGSCSPQPG